MARSRKDQLIHEIKFAIGRIDEYGHEVVHSDEVTTPTPPEKRMTMERKRQAAMETVEYTLAQERLAAKRARGN